MKVSWRLAMAALAAFPLTFTATQNPATPDLATVQGVVTRAGTNVPLPGAQVTLEGGAADPAALRVLLNTAASQGIVATTPPGASTADILQSLAAAAQARGLPLTTANLQSQLSSLSGRTPPNAKTDSEGKFAFPDIAAGTYTVRVQLEGYFGQLEGGVYQPTAAVDVSVSDKETRRADVVMIPGALIGGRVFDANGQPMSNATVQILTVAYAFNQAVMAPLVSKVTDDRGEFRLFWVAPGDYYLAATPPQAAATPGTPLPPPVVKTFYPGVSTVKQSRMVSIKGGENIVGMDIAMRPTATFKISGQVSNLVPPPPLTLGATNPGVNGAALLLLSEDADTPEDIAAQTIAAVLLLPTVGRFEVPNILPGRYELFARVSDPAAQVAGGQPLAWGSTRLEVHDSDVSNLAITISPSVDVPGTVVGVDGSKPPVSARIQILPDGPETKIAAYRALFTRSATVNAEGSFRIASVPPGHFRISTVAGLPADLFVADVRRNAQSVFDAGFEVGSSVPAPLEIVLGAGAGTVQGTVQSGPQKVAAGATVVLIPEAPRRANKALYIAAVSGTDGKFLIRGVPPGDYKLFAWESIPALAFQNAGFLAAYEERGRFIHVIERSTVNAELAVIPAGTAR